MRNIFRSTSARGTRCSWTACGWARSTPSRSASTSSSSGDGTAPRSQKRPVLLNNSFVCLDTKTTVLVDNDALKCILTDEMPTEDDRGPREHDRAPRETQGRGKQQQQRQTRGRQRPGRRRRGTAPLGGSQGIPRGQWGVRTR